MLNRLENLAVFLHSFRWWFFALCATVFLGLAILNFRGHDVTWPFALSFMWLFGLAFFVELFQRSKWLEEAKRMKDVRPGFLYRFVTSEAYGYLSVCFLVFWLGFLTFVTIQVGRS